VYNSGSSGLDSGGVETVDWTEVRCSMLQTGEADAVELRRREEARRLAAARRRNDELAYHGKTSETADGRPHREVQTELYLEELTDHVEEMDVSCQTDAFLDRPPSPLFIPAKTGLDADTQVYDGDVRIVVYA